MATKQFTTRFTPEDLRMLDELKDRMGESTASILRRAISSYYYHAKEGKEYEARAGTVGSNMDKLAENLIDLITKYFQQKNIQKL